MADCGAPEQHAADRDGRTERAVTGAGLDECARVVIAGSSDESCDGEGRHHRPRRERLAEGVDDHAHVDELGVERQRQQLLLGERGPRGRERLRAVALDGRSRLVDQRGRLGEAADGVGKGSLLGRHGQRAPRHQRILEQVSVWRKAGNPRGAAFSDDPSGLQSKTMTSTNNARIVPRVAGVLGRFTKAARPVDLPPPRLLELPGRGRTCVIDAPGPDGAPTVILLHALATTAALSWYPSVQALTEHYRVIAFDQRWHGRGIQSDRFLLADCADDVVAVADALGVEKFMLVGYSMGGAVAQLAWKRHRDRVNGLVLAATARNFRGKATERLWFSMTAAAMNRWGERARVGMLKVASALSDQPAGLSKAADRMAPWAMSEFRSTSAWSIFAALDEVGRFDSATWI